jgi:hypothetical protein
MNIARFAFCILLVALFWDAGCATRTPDPLAGWRCIGYNASSVDKTIRDDYQDFIQKLPTNERGYNVGPIQFFEDGMGKHAVEFEVFVGGNTSWRCALIYDKENKRVKVIKHDHSRYMS